MPAALSPLRANRRRHDEKRPDLNIEPMRLFSYVVRWDTGFAPNPFWSVCTLATCKPDIRRQACKGDWIVGTGSAATVSGLKIVYAMRVDDVLPLDRYDRDQRFLRKRPNMHGTPRQHVGDNIYSRRRDGMWRQRVSRHSAKDMARDLRGENALVSRTFWYWGRNAITLPASLHGIVRRGPGHRSNIDEKTIKRLIGWLGRKQRGRRGLPLQGSLFCCDCSPAAAGP